MSSISGRNILASLFCSCFLDPVEVWVDLVLHSTRVGNASCEFSFLITMMHDHGRSFYLHTMIQPVVIIASWMCSWKLREVVAMEVAQMNRTREGQGPFGSSPSSSSSSHHERHLDIIHWASFHFYKQRILDMMCLLKNSECITLLYFCRGRRVCCLELVFITPRILYSQQH